MLREVLSVLHSSEVSRGCSVVTRGFTECCVSGLDTKAMCTAVVKKSPVPNCIESLYIQP